MSFNLLRAAWIPVRAPSGAARWIAAAEIGDLGDEPFDIEWGRPEFRIATLELLIGLFAVALADELREGSDWARLLDRPPPRRDLAERLAPLEPYFDLDGEGPRFLQDFDVLDGETRSLEMLLIDGPPEGSSEAQAAFFQKRGRFRILSRGAAAIAIYAMQAFAPSGGRGHRTSMRGGGPLTTLVVPQRPTLWRRIVANLPLMREEELEPPDDLRLVFPWAAPTRTSAKGETTTPGALAHRLQCYFGMPRRLRLVFAPNAERAPCAITGEIDETAAVGFVTAPWGVSYDQYRHPLSPYYAPKPGEKPLPIHAQSGRVGYRDWTGYLFAKGGVDLRAQQLRDFQGVFPQKGARLEATGFVMDNMKCLDWVESESPLYLLANAAAHDRLASYAHERLVAAAGLVAFVLRGALRDALGVEDVQKTLIAAAHDRFWIETDEGFFVALDAAHARLGALAPDAEKDVVQNLDLSDVSATWLATMRRVARRIFDETAQIERLGDLDEAAARRAVEAAKSLQRFLDGDEKLGGDLFTTLGLSAPTAAQTEKKGAKP